MEAVIFIGVQASGKSTYYKREFFRSHVRISLDMLRTRNRERLLMRACLQSESRFVLDNTNVTRTERAAYISEAHTRGFQVVGYYFASSAADCLARNARRGGAERIPDKGVLGTYNRLQIPNPDEGFDKLFYVRMNTESTEEFSSNSSCAGQGTGEFTVEEWKDEI